VKSWKALTPLHQNKVMKSKITEEDRALAKSLYADLMKTTETNDAAQVLIAISLLKKHLIAAQERSESINHGQ
jgi:hypothetical protein